jgi:hypothetical protein
MSDTQLTSNGRKCAAIVCTHVATGLHPILLAERGESEEAADSGWQFLCGIEEEDWGAAQVWSVQEVLEIDASLATLVEMPVGTRLVRATATANWEAVPPVHDQQ